MNLQEQQIAAQLQEENMSAHKQWLEHPTTQRMFRVLAAHEMSLLDSAVGQSEQVGKDENYFRHKLIAVRTVRAVKILLESTEQFTSIYK